MFTFVRLSPLLFVLYLLCNCYEAEAKPVTLGCDGHLISSSLYSDIAELEQVVSPNKGLPPALLAQLLKWKPVKNKKLIAALLAFPFPFGIVGLHRIYLGTSPHVPVVYIATLGGGFGLIPLFDFFAILFEKDPERFMNNHHVFMWIN